MKVRVVKFAGEHRTFGRLDVDRELDVDEEFFQANKSFLECIDGSTGTFDIEEEDDSGESTESLSDNSNDETGSDPEED